MRSLPIAWSIAFLLAAGARTEPLDPDAARRELLDGVAAIVAPGVPGNLVVTGAAATVVVTGTSHGTAAAVVAAAPFGAGRVVAVGHPGLLEPGGRATADTARWLANAIRWAARGRTPVRIVCRDVPPAKDALPDAVTLTGRPVLDAAALADAEVALVWTHKLAPAEVAALSAWIAAGGGAIVSGLGWTWLHNEHPGGDLTAGHPGNQLLRPAGIAWGLAYVTPQSAGRFATPRSVDAHAHLARALDDLEQAVERGDAAAPPAASGFPALLTGLAPADPQRARLAALADLTERKAPIRVSRAAPLVRARWRERLGLQLQEFLFDAAAVDRVAASPDAAEFPGAVPADAPALTETVQVDVSVPGWTSTGLYARPGAPVEVSLASGATALGLELRIGCHSDTLWGLDEWRRRPAISHTVRLDRAVTRMASPHGGLVYVQVPDACAPAVVDVHIAGAVGAPCFELGRTSLDDWKRQRTTRRAPWAELASETLVLSVPAAAVTTVDDPGPVLALWDRVRRAQLEFSGRPPSRRRERFVPDEQIANGYLHSGYPIMSHLDLVGPTLDAAAMERGGSWGHFHELGHNLQEPDWTFEGTTEVTCNLFTLYAMDRVVRLAPATHPQLAGVSERARLHRANGAPFEEWKKDPFLALWMYVQVQHKYGWEPFQKLFREYRALPAAERPTTDDQKRDQWLIRLSRAVRRDLGPFFRTWGVPVSAAALAEAARVR